MNSTGRISLCWSLFAARAAGRALAGSVAVRGREDRARNMELVSDAASRMAVKASSDVSEQSSRHASMIG